MAQTREIKKRMTAVKTIQRITKTMQMIATARFQSLQRKATQARAFANRLHEVVGDIAASLGEENQLDLPLLGHRREDPDAVVNEEQSASRDRELLLVLTSNRGLCGSYNTNLLRTLSAYYREHHDNPPILHMVGRKGMAYARYNRMPVDEQHTQFGDQPPYAEVMALADQYMQWFIEGRFARIKVLFMSFESMSRQYPRIVQLLPLEAPHAQDAATGINVDYDFLPDAASLMGDLLPMTVRLQLFQCFNEAAVSEQLARMVAMKAATDAAGKQKKELSRKYNRARQAAITTELTEIISGSAAQA